MAGAVQLLRNRRMPFNMFEKVGRGNAIFDDRKPKRHWCFAVGANRLRIDCRRVLLVLHAQTAAQASEAILCASEDGAV